MFIFFTFYERINKEDSERIGEQPKRQTESELIKGGKDLFKINMFWDTTSVQRNQERLNCPDCVSCHSRFKQYSYY